MGIKNVIRKLERQRRELTEIIAALRRIDALGPFKLDPQMSFANFERAVVARALERAGGNQSEAARILSVTRDTVRYKIAKHGLNKP